VEEVSKENKINKINSYNLVALTTLFKSSKINIIAYSFGCFIETLFVFVRQRHGSRGRCKILVKGDQ
jgi:hypothetical protein